MDFESDDELNLSCEETEEIEEKDREKIREKLSTMSFEDIQKLKEKIGSKIYDETFFGKKRTKSRADYKRANKNRPREMSSKTRIKVSNTVIPVKKTVARDPRFDTMCGEFNEKTFKSNYNFVNDIRKKERKELEKKLQNTNDPKRQEQIKYLMQRIDNQIREQDKRDKMEQEKLQEKIEIKQKLKRGEKPIFKKKSEKKIEDLINRYEDLKKTNKLQKHIEKRSKKLSVKGKMLNEKIKG